MSKEVTVSNLIAKWTAYRAAVPEPDRWCRLRQDLYEVRNPGYNGAPPLSVWPPHLLDSDDEIMASVEHYFLSRCWVGTGQFPAWEMRTMGKIYETGKKFGVTPRHNPSRPVTPPSAMQTRFREDGIRDGEADLARFGGKAPLVAKPPKYY